MLAAVFVISFVSVRERHGVTSVQSGDLLGQNVFADAPGSGDGGGDGGDDGDDGGDDGDDGGGL